MPNQIEHADAVVPAEAMPDDEDKEKEPMDDEEVESEIGRLIDEASSYSDTELTPARKQATDYYLARPFGDEEKGRSQVVSTEVRDVVRATLPSFMRIFFGPDRAVEYAPNSAEQVEGAEQATEFISDVVIRKDNNGFLQLYSAFKDALVRRRGVVKWWWDDVTTIEEYSLTAMTMETLLVLEADKNVEYEITAQYEHTDPKAMAAYAVIQQARDEALANGAQITELGEPPQPPETITLYDVDVVVTNPDGRARFATMPSEEFIHSGDARSIEEATAVIHRSDKTRSELVAIGVPFDILEEIGAAGAGTKLSKQEEKVNRMPGQNTPPPSETEEANVKVPYYEVYVYMDRNGDGVAEHLRVLAVGTVPKVWDVERWPERPFAIFEIDPEPHTMNGQSYADYVMDLQLIKSKVMRGSLDSMAFSLHPRTTVVEGEVEIADVMNTEIGAIIRQRQPGMVGELTHQSNAAITLPWLQYLDEQKENRVGVSKAAAGLDPNSLQSSTQAAVAATVTGAQQHLDLGARLLAETGMRQLMRGLLKLVIINQPASRMVRLRGKFVSVDPRVWDSTMDVNVKIGIGMTRKEERIAVLQGLAQKQVEILTQLGPSNPVVSLGQYVNTLHDLAELGGEIDTTRFFNRLPLDFQPQPQEPQQSPEDILAQASAKKVEVDAQIAAEKLKLQDMEIRLRDDRERDKNEAEAFIRAKDTELKYKLQGAKIAADVQAMMARKRGEGGTE